ncbi:hypothetical protein BH09PSE5_BH09PSE5_37720 [soil metagenome]
MNPNPESTPVTRVLGEGSETTTYVAGSPTTIDDTDEFAQAPDVDAENRDPISGEPGAHPVGTGLGAAAGGMAAGAAVGTMAGPVGTAIGAAVGAIVGGLAGKGVAEKVDPTDPRALPSQD